MGALDSLTATPFSAGAAAPSPSSTPASVVSPKVGALNTLTSKPAVTGSSASSMRSLVSQPFSATPSAGPKPFEGYEPSGSFVGIATSTDPYSGRPYLAYKMPGQATTTDITRTAPFKNPEIAQPQARSDFENPRMPQSASQYYRHVMGATSNEQLDHRMAVSLGGSNNPANLKPIPTAENQTAGKGEGQMASAIAAGKQSLFDAQNEEAKAKGLATPWTDQSENPMFPTPKDTASDDKARLDAIINAPQVPKNAKPGDTFIWQGKSYTVQKPPALGALNTNADFSVNKNTKTTTGSSGLVAVPSGGLAAKQNTPWAASPLGTAVNTILGLPEGVSKLLKGEAPLDAAAITGDQSSNEGAGGIATNTALGLVPAAWGIVQGIARDIVSAGMSGGQAVLPEGSGTTAIPPENMRWLLGAEPIQSLTDIAADYSNAIANNPVAQSTGVSKYAGFLGTIGATVPVGLDFAGWSGGEKGVIDAIVKSKDAGEIATILQKLGVQSELALQYAPRLVEVDNPKTVKGTLAMLEALQKTTKVAPNAMGNLSHAVSDASHPLVKEEAAQDFKNTYESFKRQPKGSPIDTPKQRITISSLSGDVQKSMGSDAQTVDITHAAIKHIADKPENFPKDAVDQLPHIVENPDTISKKYKGSSDQPPRYLLSRGDYTAVVEVSADKKTNTVVTVFKSSPKYMEKFEKVFRQPPVREAGGIESSIPEVKNNARDTAPFKFEQPDRFPKGEKIEPTGPAEVIGTETLNKAHADWKENFADPHAALYKEGQTLKSELNKARGVNKELLQSKLDGVIARQQQLEQQFVSKWRQEAGLPAEVPNDKGVDVAPMFHEHAIEQVSHSGTMKNFAELLERTVRQRLSIETFLREANGIYDATDPLVRADLLTVYAKAMQGTRTVSPEAIRAGVYQFEMNRARADMLTSLLRNRVRMPASVLNEFPQGELRSLGTLMSEQVRTVKDKVHLLDYFATPEFVLEKLGLGKASKLLQKAKQQYQSLLPKEIGKIDAWRERVGKSPEKSQLLFKWLDGQKNINLEGEDLKVAQEIRNYLSHWADRLGLPVHQRLAHYITHIFEDQLIKKEFDDDLARLIEGRTPGSVYDPFLQRRLGMMGYKEDVWSALDAYTKRAIRKESFDPALDELKHSASKLDLESEKYVTRLAHRINLRPTEIEKLTDNLLKSIPRIGYKLGQRPTARITGTIRNIYYRGLLGLNVGSALRNLTQGANTYAKLGEKYTVIGYTKLFTRMVSKNLNELVETGVLSDALVQDRKIGVFKSTLQKADKGLFALFDIAEKINRGSAYFGAKEMALGRGLTEEQAREFAVRMVRETQFAFSNVDTPVIMSSDLVKTGAQLQSYSIKQIEFLARMLKNKEYAGLIRYSLASVAMLYSIGRLFGMKPTDLIPSVGLGGSPIGNLLTAGAESLSPSQQTRDKGHKDFQNSLTAIIPAGAQIKKTYVGTTDYLKGRATTAKGTTKYTIAPDAITGIRAALFGESTLPEAQNYFNGPSKTDAATSQWQHLKTLPQQQAKAELSKIAATDPAEAKRILAAADNERLGVTADDTILKGLSIQNGDRSRAIADHLDKLGSNDEKKKYLADLSSKKILTAKVLQQVLQLIQP